MVAAMQGISAIIAPILSTTLYQVNHASPMALIAILTALLGAAMLARYRKRPNHGAVDRMEGQEIHAGSEGAR